MDIFNERVNDNTKSNGNGNNQPNLNLGMITSYQKSRYPMEFKYKNRKLLINISSIRDEKQILISMKLQN